MERLGGNEQPRGGAGEWDNMGTEAYAGDLLDKLREVMQEKRERGISAENKASTLQAIAKYEERQGRKITEGEMRAIVRAEGSFYGVVQVDSEGNQFNNAGKVFEKGLTELIIDEFGYDVKKQGIFSQKVRNESTRKPDIAEDVLEGADVMIHKLPVDITVNAGKSGEIGSVNDDGEVVDGFRQVGKVGSVRVSSGFRKTNGVHKLNTPVCVMLFESGDNLPVEDMLEIIRRNSAEFRGVTDEALGSYWDYADATEEAA